VDACPTIIGSARGAGDRTCVLSSLSGFARLVALELRRLAVKLRGLLESGLRVTVRAFGAGELKRVLGLVEGEQSLIAVLHGLDAVLFDRDIVDRRLAVSGADQRGSRGVGRNYQRWCTSGRI